MCLGLGVTLGPLLVQCGDEHGEERSGQAHMNDGFHMDGGGIEASPLMQDEIEWCPGEMHQETRHQLIRLFRLFQLIPCHSDASKVSKHGPGLFF